MCYWCLAGSIALISYWKNFKIIFVRHSTHHRVYNTRDNDSHHRLTKTWLVRIISIYLYLCPSTRRTHTIFFTTYILMYLQLFFFSSSFADNCCDVFILTIVIILFSFYIDPNNILSSDIYRIIANKQYNRHCAVTKHKKLFASN